MTQNEVSDDLPVFFKWGHTHTTSIAGFVGNTDTSGRMW